MQSVHTDNNQDSRPRSEVSGWDPLGEVALTVSTLGGMATFGAMVAGPVGVVIGGVVGGLLRLGATGHLPNLTRRS
jgi:hypothetical protein